MGRRRPRNAFGSYVGYVEIHYDNNLSSLLGRNKAREIRSTSAYQRAPLPVICFTQEVKFNTISRTIKQVENYNKKIQMHFNSKRISKVQEVELMLVETRSELLCPWTTQDTFRLL